MKNKILTFVLIMASILGLIGLTGCNNVINPDEVLNSPDSKLVDFEIIEDNYYGFILVDKNTNVMYYWLGTSVGGITPIYNADGSLKLYEE